MTENDTISIKKLFLKVFICGWSLETVIQCRYDCDIGKDLNTIVI